MAKKIILLKERRKDNEKMQYLMKEKKGKERKSGGKTSFTMHIRLYLFGLSNDVRIEKKAARDGNKRIYLEFLKKIKKEKERK